MLRSMRCTLCIGKVVCCSRPTISLIPELYERLPDDESKASAHYAVLQDGKSVQTQTKDLGD